MMDMVFDACVRILLALAGWTGLSYKEVNVWIFVVVWPLLTAAMAVWIVRREMLIRRLLRERGKGAGGSGRGAER
jgi:amino acid transporter